MTEQKTAQYDVMSGAQDEQIAALTADNVVLRQALEPFKRFCEVFDSKPINGLDAEQIYGIHGGKYVEGGIAIEWEHMRVAQRALQSPSPSVDLLKRHAEELAAAKQQAQKYYGAKFTMVNENCVALRQRAEAAEARADEKIMGAREGWTRFREAEAELSRIRATNVTSMGLLVARCEELRQRAEAAEAALATDTKNRVAIRADGLLLENRNLMAALERYGEHEDMCSSLYADENSCTCGFDAAMEAIRSASRQSRTVAIPEAREPASESERHD